jgi:hypothetical protein
MIKEEYYEKFCNYFMREKINLHLRLKGRLSTEKFLYIFPV